MPSNGYVENNVLYVDGTETWADLTDTWADYDSWTLYTGADYGGAPGQPLRYQTAIIDLGSIIQVVPRITVGTTGDSLVTIEYSNNSDMSGSSFMSPYTTDNTATGTLDHYWVLNWCKPGYISEYEDFTARYVRVTVYVENFNADSTARLAPALNNLYIIFEKPEFQRELLNDVDTATLAGSIAGRQLEFEKIGNLNNIQIQPHEFSPVTNQYILTPVIDKSTATMRILRYDTINGGVSANVDHTVDITAFGSPLIDVFEDGVIRPRDV